MSHHPARRRLLTCLLVGVALTSAGCSEGIKALMEAAARVLDTDRAIGAQITQYGIAQVELGDGVVETPTTTTGEMREVLDVQYDTTTDRIPATLGTSFGVQYIIWGAPRGSWVPLEMRTVHPPLTNPATGRTTTQSVWQTEARVGDISGRIYTLEYDWEVVPGDWSFEIYYEGTLIEKQDFILYDPDME